MRSRLTDQPTWVWALVSGLFIGLVTALVRVGAAQVIDPGSSLTTNAVSGFLNGLVLGLVMVPLTVRMNRRQRERTGLEGDELTQAQRASAKGRVPDDLRLLRAARDLCADRIAMLERRRVWLVGSQVLIAILTVMAAFAWSLGFLVVTGVVAGLGVYLALLPRIVRRRLAVLDRALAERGFPSHM